MKSDWQIRREEEQREYVRHTYNHEKFKRRQRVTAIVTGLIMGTALIYLIIRYV